MTAHILGAGDGYKYLTSSVASADVAPDAGESLSEYYLRSGNPPGRWYGRGADHLGVAGEVTEEQMGHLYGLGEHPVTGAALGSKYRVYRSVEERTLAALDAEPDATPERQAEIIEAVAAVGQRQAVAGFDCTFSPVKSVSVLWALGDEELRRSIDQAHQEAWRDTIDWIESDVARTRSGTDGIEYRSVQGVTVAAFDHRTSRTGDPQVHTHVVISNKVRDETGRWLTLDSRAVLKATVAASERYNTRLEGILTRTMGWRFTDAGRGIREIAGVPPEVITAFSKRRAQLDARYDELVVEYVSTHGHQPPPELQHRLAQQATLDTRPAKEDDADWSTMRERWAAEAAAGGNDPDRIFAAVTEASTEPAGLVDVDIEAAADAVIDAVIERRATWTVRHLQPEAERHLRVTLGLAAHPDIDALAAAIVERALDKSISLESPELVASPEVLQIDGGTKWRPATDRRYSAVRILEAEDRLVAAHRSETRTPVSADTVADVLAGESGARLSPDQAAAVERLALSARPLDLLVGPAGAGKTTTLRALIDVWREAGGTVTGLATSAAAAKVLANECEIPTDNTAKWRHTHRTTPGEGLDALSPGQLILVDEAGMADTLTLDELTAAAEAAGARVVLVGDHRQLGAVAAGGAMRLLHAQGHAAELHQLHRFSESWEAEASMRLRSGDPSVAATYTAQGRVHQGLPAVMRDAVFTAWQDDVDAGRTAVMVAGANDDVALLSQRARLHRLERGAVDRRGRSVELATGSEASAGDVVVTRRNDRTNLTNRGRDWVKNGDLWTVAKVHSDGDVSLVHQVHGGTVRLDAAYAGEHLELGYATTIHRAQGVTVDRAHVLVDDTTASESLYVAMTRGRDANHVYLATAGVDIDGERPPPPAAAAGDAFAAVIGRSGLELSATETVAASFDSEAAIATLAGRYHHTLALIEQALPDPVAVLRPDEAADVTGSDAWPAAEAAIRTLRRAGRSDSEIHDLIYDGRPVLAAEDPAAVIAWRLRLHTAAATILPPAPADGPAQLLEYAAELRRELAAAARAHAADRWASTGLAPDLADEIATYRVVSGWDGPDAIGPLPDNPFAQRAWRALRERLDTLPVDEAAELVDAACTGAADAELERRLEELTHRFTENRRDLGSDLPDAAPPPDPGPVDPAGPTGPEIGF
jgi:conjugative relaxase-like TrwC/TraI family protein